MSRVFWDTMLFAYLLDGNPKYVARVRGVLERSYERGDTLITSSLAVGEVMAGKSDPDTAQLMKATIEQMGFSFLSFDTRCIDTFWYLRSGLKLKAPDSIHIACAAAANVDLFMTGDKKLLGRRLHLNGIQFITNFETVVF